MSITYLDHHATTPCDPHVAAAMWPWFVEHFGNAGSAQHVSGRLAATAVEQARAQVATLIGADPAELVFTSGATEANNLAIRGTVEAVDGPAHVVTSNIEHPSVLDTVAALRLRGIEVSLVPVDARGLVCVDAIRSALRPHTVLVSLMLANNEIGTVQPVAEVAKVCREARVLLHTDATQCVGHETVRVRELGVDLLSLSAHKMYGPKGIGALYIRGGSPRVRIRAQQTGGGQERGLRSGTVPVPLVVGLGAACERAGELLSLDERSRVRALRDTLLAGLLHAGDVFVNGTLDERLGHNLSVRIDGVEAAALLAVVPELALSMGSACASVKATPSHVLSALGLSDVQARSTVRFGLGRATTEADIDRAIARLVDAIRSLRGRGPAIP